MIPHVRKLFQEVHALLRFRLEPDGSGHQVNTEPGANGNHKGNGHGNGNGHHEDNDSRETDYSGWSDEKRHEAAYRLLNALQTQGIIIQDVERGLIDFPTIRDGREVFLCYELNDGSSIGYFHDIAAGYAGRQKITETHR